jgi:methionine aminopeptidase
MMNRFDLQDRWLTRLCFVMAALLLLSVLRCLASGTVFILLLTDSEVLAKSISSLSAQYEHTIAILPEGPLILT